ncbi:hypothetical protein C4J89_2007 [Pseudomonas sp. R4-35-07]|nr:hypothetical protein C4J92_1992 [Pseudomonas sp. R3-18-08]AZF20788.1 hypothetical protein C4J91_2038 [Pseudomonas sp. R3-52-08]AZF26116.1 hypothetical protein C4J90_1943 [Pseudomonas sp. R2-60-08W]AZF31482.1 hypothetical protein C4J89_2007 [Pseudomonas sp. R4-35-07]AZF36760.1 hypothetical protein C4J88_1977 [Pseudomonas sp. R4-39-08]AZF52425.1 hypothetical protein C4J85_1940 [Pseudomonas sp. R4-34-07]
MSYAYEGLATATVLSLYLGQPSKDLTMLELNARVRNVGTGRFRTSSTVTCRARMKRTPCA